MKRFLLAALSILLSLNLLGMEKAAPDLPIPKSQNSPKRKIVDSEKDVSLITKKIALENIDTQFSYTKPTFIALEKHFKIACSCNGKEVAFIKYTEAPNHTWHIEELWVDREYRNLKIGFSLLNRFYQFVINSGYKKITLLVMPLDPHGPYLDQLVSFYQNTFKRFGLDQSNIILEEDPDNLFLACVRMQINLIDKAKEQNFA